MSKQFGKFKKYTGLGEALFSIFNARNLVTFHSQETFEIQLHFFLYKNKT